MLNKFNERHNLIALGVIGLKITFVTHIDVPIYVKYTHCLSLLSRYFLWFFCATKI